MKTNHRNFWLAAAALLAAFTLPVGAATVTATLDPPQISMGDSTQLTVTVSGAQGQPSVPDVDGLEITPVGQSTQVEIINGSVTANASNTYQITPQREGTFVIPAIRLGNAASQPITLRVGQGSANPAPPAPAAPPPSSNGPVVLPPPAVAPSPDEANSAPQGRFGSIRITLPKKELYEGELVPVKIEAYIPDDLQATVTDLPQFTSDGLTLNSLSTKPEQETQVLNGRPYHVLTWHSALTAVKTGNYPINLEMPVTVVVPQPGAQDDDDDLFNNFFKNAMAAMGTKKNVTLRSGPESLQVLPLPQANRPADFSGAVGQFEVEASATPTQVNAGDPITLRLKVSGTGNFDRVSSDLLAGDSHWKTYSPKSHFDAQDSVGSQGVKTFEQPIIPNDASVTTIPSLSFSFFDPEKRQYVTRTTAPVAVTVSGNSVSPAASPTGAGTVAAAPPPSQPQVPSSAPAPAESDLRPNKIEEGSFVSTLRPVYLNPWFIAGQGLPLLALVLGLALLRRRERVSHPERVRASAAQQAIRRQIDAMDEAMRNHQTDAFFIHARNALQQRLGQQWNLRPETITLADVEARLGGQGENVRPIFQMADQASYSDLHFEEADLRQWRQVVVNELTEKN